MTDPVAMLRTVAELLLTDVAGHSPRSTEDVDAISEVSTRLELAEFEAKLRKLGFKPDRERTTCSWLLDDLMLDIMPMNGDLLGLDSRWFPEAARHSQIELVDGREELGDEAAAAAPELRRYLKVTLARLLDSPDFNLLVSSHLRGDAGSQNRLPLILERIARLAGREAK